MYFDRLKIYQYNIMSISDIRDPTTAEVADAQTYTTFNIYKVIEGNYETLLKDLDDHIAKVEPIVSNGLAGGKRRNKRSYKKTRRCGKKTRHCRKKRTSRRK